MGKRVIDVDVILNRAKPLAHQHAPEMPRYGHLVRLPIALADSTCKQSVETLKQVLADTIALRDLCEKHLWFAKAAPTFYRDDNLTRSLSGRCRFSAHVECDIASLNLRQIERNGLCAVGDV